MHVRGAKVAQLARDVPVTYLLFDVMHFDGVNTMGLTYAKRRELLAGLDLNADHLLTPPSFDEEPTIVLAASLAQGLEGVVVKASDSVYLPGRRSPAWIKVKHQRMQEVVIGGWKPGEGARAGRIGSLLLGVNNDAGELSLCRTCRDRLQRSCFGGSRRPIAGARTQDEPVRGRGAATARARRPVGDAEAGR